MRILQKLTTTLRPQIPGGPFAASIQIRRRKPADTAQTRIETRTLDPKLDLLAFHRRRLALALSVHALVSSRKRGPFVSVQLLSRWAPHAGVETLTAGEFLRKYPHVFEVFTHPVRKNACCKFTPNFVKFLELEDEIVSGMEEMNVIKLRKILTMSVNGRVHLHAIRLMRRELGFPEDFRDSIIRKHIELFRMVDWEIVELVDWNENVEKTKAFTAKIEEWREKEYIEKWLSEFEVKYAFPINFPTGFKIVPGFKEKLRNWQRLSYIKPYEKVEKARARSCGGVERYEKRAVGIIHELLYLTVEKMVEIERLAHFRKDLGIEVNLRELILKHPGIFYMSTRGKTQMVFLREAYSKGRLIETDELYDVRRKMLELILLGSRFTRVMREGKEDFENEECVEKSENRGGDPKDGDFVIPILEGCSGK
ncbi:Ubiquitin carboxyl-terminal hydrolase family protein [Striga hermonthica]|uniref:Ubiquitin carboxyl-terminal hydrolase family protein n=1 Tax=Striga hermonthica TaxID=68872 RepID=A0A9N7MTK6_STRHE|nr:Ubiquitin carboxyl-terminal hydrolase family protein [Striga hermonthica]